MPINFNGKFFRRTIGLLIVLSLIVVVVPSLFRTQASKAIINARAVPINAPIDGVIKDIYKPSGTFADSGQSILRIDNPRISESLVQELTVNRRALEDQIQGLAQQKARLDQLLIDFRGRVQMHAKYETARLEHQIAEARAQALAQKGTVDDLQLTLEKNTKLLNEKFISAVEFDRSKYALETARQQLISNEARIKALQEAKSALDAGVYIGEGRNDVPYTQQKYEDIKIQLIDIDARLAQSRSRLDALGTQLSVERLRLEKLRQANITAPVNGLVWRQYFSVGSEVGLGAKLVEMVDCNHLFIEAALPASALANLSVGDPVSYRLLGSPDWSVGKVQRLSGGASQIPDDTLAARLNGDADEGRIAVSLDRKALSDMVANQCYVGRRVEVTLNRQWNPKVLLTRFSDLLR